LGGLLEEGAHEKSPKCLGGNLGDFGGILQRSQHRTFREITFDSASTSSYYFSHLFELQQTESLF